jgi:bidirectional [NiFe] hydrogenase diaphorase subunit
MMPEELEEIALIEQEAADQYMHHIDVCVASGCVSSQSDQIKEAIEKEVHRRGEERWCRVRGVGCMGLCTAGPLVATSEHMYQEVKIGDSMDIIDSLEGAPLEHLLCDTSQPFFEQQVKVVLENSGKIDPDRIEDYIAAKGYTGLLKALTEMTPADVIEEIVQSGLRGRGGGGYPTALKWSTVAKAVGARKFVICNADEGDPGAFMDRSVLESDPHRVLEGMAVAAYAVGASEGYIYVRAEYPLAIKRLRNAIRQAERLGLLGNRIFGTTFSLHIEVRLGAGAFVCGEETALISSIEGKRGTPRPRPPYPAEYGLWGAPTLINNVETFANVPTIIRNGGDWYASIGTEKSKGTKVFALAGRVNNTGIIEVPMGTKLRDIIYEIGGGIPDGQHFKAVQTGGPSGGCIPEQYLDMSVDYESLAQVGSIMGSGGMIVMDSTSSMVDVARYFMEFCMSESCGKCVPCRVGTAQMYELLTRISEGMAHPEDLEMLQELCDVVQSTSLCGLGKSSPNPVLSTLHYFHDEYMAHIRQ